MSDKAQPTPCRNGDFVRPGRIRPSQLIMPEEEFGKRLAPRKQVKKSCQILYNCGKVPMPASLMDISVTGCRLEISDPSQIFDTFLLKVKSSGLERHFKVVWRAGNQIGATCTN